MDHEKADRIIELLEEISDKLDLIRMSTDSVQTDCDKMVSKVSKLKDIDDNVDSIRRIL